MPDAVSTTTSQLGRRLAQARQGLEPVEPRHREVEQDQVGLQLARRVDRLARRRRPRPTTLKSCCVKQRRRAPSRVSGWSSTMRTRVAIALCPLSAGSLLPKRGKCGTTTVRLPVLALGRDPPVRPARGRARALRRVPEPAAPRYELPQVAARARHDGRARRRCSSPCSPGVRFSVEGRRLDLPALRRLLARRRLRPSLRDRARLGGQPLHRTEAWARIVGGGARLDR